jgi:hypothetical protein
MLNRHLSEIDAFQPSEAWSDAIRGALASSTPKSVATKWKDGVERKTHFVPEPSSDFQPASVFCLTCV